MTSFHRKNTSPPSLRTPIMRSPPPMDRNSPQSRYCLSPGKLCSSRSWLRRLAWPQCNTGEIYYKLEWMLKKSIEAEKDKRTLLWVLFWKTDHMKYVMTTWMLPKSWIVSKTPFCCPQREITQTNVGNCSIAEANAVNCQAQTNNATAIPQLEFCRELAM